MTPANFQAIRFFVLQLDQIDNNLVRNGKNVKQNLMFDHIENRIKQFSCFVHEKMTLDILTDLKQSN